MEAGMDTGHHSAHHKHHREHHKHDRQHHGGLGTWLKGFLIGAAAGTAASILMAPQSGRQTRELVRYKATQLRQLAEQTADEARQKVETLKDDARLQAQNLAQSGREMLDQQKERVSRVAHAVKDTWEDGGRSPEETDGERDAAAEQAQARM
jgi:gas vesicle protein